ncbi:hypothetical protein [Geoglobus acetivorans]|uniref:S-layer domain protein n=1 Tax=Geoglobus acetivorans TaxID=565033 RepID=A0ABZ3H3W3_GEOAI|nr:hypothetical protein [Geoglobus acetivorans]
MKRRSIFSVLILAAFLLAMGVASAESADFRFHVSPVRDTFYPGEDAVLTLLIENDAKVSSFIINENTSNLLPLITTAKNLRVELSGSPPVEVKTINPQLAGDLPSGMVSKVSFRIKIDPDAREKEYTLTVKIHFTYVTYSIDPLTKTAYITYDHDVYLKNVNIRVSKKDYDFNVRILNSTLLAGKKDVVSVEVINTGKNPVHNTSVILNATPPLMPDPTGMIAYIGDLASGEKRTVSFKVYVSENALNQSYPARFVFQFSDAAGFPKTAVKTAPIWVEGSNSIEVENWQSILTPPLNAPVRQKISVPSLPSIPSIPSLPSSSPSFLSGKKVQPASGVVTIPSRGIVEVTLKNTGEEMRDAVAILSFDTPLIRVENSPYIGHLGRNESVRVLFNVENLAQEGKYRGWVAISYTNPRGDEVLTEKHYIAVEIGESPLQIRDVKALLSAGQKGEMVVEVENGIKERLEDVELSLLSPELTITPLTTTAFIGSLESGKVGNARFRIDVDDDAVLGNYTLYLLERFEINGAEIVSSARIPVSVESRGVKIEITSVEASLYPDSTGEVVIKLKNSGSTLYNTIVMLEVSAPLSVAGGSSLGSLVGQSQPGMYFVGTLEPGSTAVVKYRVKVDKDAGAGSYPANLRLSYYDAEGYKHETGSFPIALEVKEKPLITPVLFAAAALGLIALLTAAVIVRRSRRKRKSEANEREK